MIDIRAVRADLAGVKAAMARRQDPSLADDIDRAAVLDSQTRDLTNRRDDLRARLNALTREVGDAYRTGDRAKGDALKDDARALGDEERVVKEKLEGVAGDLRHLLLTIPNIPSADAPEGASEEDNVVMRTVGYDPANYGAHQRVPHWEIGEQLGILDLPRGAKISGSMFPVLRGAGAALSRALCQLALDRNADAFEEIRPPTLVRTDAITASGHLPKFADEAYAVERDDLWLVPTAEVPLTSLYRDEVLDEVELPKRMMAHSTCLRREAGAAGRDTRGLLRVHEFDKVEILALCTPAQAAEVHADLLARVEARLIELGLAYQQIDICAGDLGQSHARYYDFNVYAPGSDQWLEVSSVSWFSDYQARRANIRYRPTTGSGTELVHTLNGSAIAVPRIMAALLETHRRADGSVVIPEALHPYMRGITVIEPLAT